MDAHSPGADKPQAISIGSSHNVRRIFSPIRCNRNRYTTYSSVQYSFTSPIVTRHSSVYFVYLSTDISRLHKEILHVVRRQVTRQVGRRMFYLRREHVVATNVCSSLFQRALSGHLWLAIEVPQVMKWKSGDASDTGGPMESQIYQHSHQ
jgi:hypothetical protein